MTNENEIILEERRYRNYTGSIFSEYIILTKKFILLSPLYLCGFCCTHYRYDNYKLNELNFLHHVLISTSILCVDRFIQYPACTIIFFSILSITINNDILFYIYHQYLIYGIVWIIGIKLCDFEDAQRLFPGFSLLHTPSIYLNRFFKNYSQHFLIIPYSVILIYTLLFHQKWKHDYNYESNISEKSKFWWFCSMSIFSLSHWICSIQLTNKNIILNNEIFDIYKYLDIEYLQYKGIYTFVIMFITNSQIFSNFSWRILAFCLGVLILTLLFVELFTIFDEKYNLIDTLAFGLSYFMFEPINMLVYTIISRDNWWSLVPINVFGKTILIKILKTINEKYMLFQFIPSWIIYVISIVFIQNEFKSLDI